ncbi:glycerate kinase type-2 family protein [Pseudoroseicyclus tamaricis]|uniref:Glycerate kinase n=1 Tax=Pseudoroseicyclus tamaricis TaxID=2705421 RepID=A0A6B2K1E4_9RHOB|nr:glycerate kinase [Pseudoroseicyclus tamaricis]NDV00166.1 glycerate kinase [Pseudoroseicyclus tamaricis]
MTSISDPRAFLTELFEAAIAAADPGRALEGAMPERPRGRTVVIGCGKGAAQLARAFEQRWDWPLEGLVVTRYGYGAPLERLELREAAHPVPDEEGLRAAKDVLKLVQGLTEDDLVVALITGGGSALLPAPGPGMSLADEIAVTEALLRSGAPISVMNVIRSELSLIKGGRLALAAAPAKVVSLIVSDVPGDRPEQVASGPTVPGAGPQSRAEARKLVEAWRIPLPEAARLALAGEDNPAPLPIDAGFARHEWRIIASAGRSLEAAEDVAIAAGIGCAILSDSMEGESREVAKVHAALLREVAGRGRPFVPPLVLLSGGETTVTLGGSAGRGGRNSEFALALALAAEGEPFHALIADTDGIDGSESNAGAFVDGDSAARLRALGQDPAALLAGHDAYSAFEALGDLFAPGPTGTNVNDFRAILIG